ncbi:short-chain dehydrogenase [Rhodoferax koreense]|uniref:Short-chain dehydrogenase n=1 Tax=Rhodoferax koreensis TaxID=1842727 RepID=A0A1P8K0N6_9BURK|nr:SDR family NAD(P)-dependent oxidoreductase [Rhodoferax koreense]APW39568.1 short-chain dehydrogenase [Rhodoferax koreense]
MQISNNTIFITGGGSGIGRGLAEALHKAGNQVIISGRRKAWLDATTAANPGMASVEMDVSDPVSISTVSAQLIRDFPKLNVVINNAGIMLIDDASTAIDETLLLSTVTTNLLGPIRVTAAFIEHLKQQPDATIYNVSSVLAFVPLAITAVYSSTKSAMHSYSQSLRWRLQGTSVKVREIAPPWVQTDLLGSNNEPRAMPLAPFIAELMTLIATDENELVVEIAKPIRAAVGPDNGTFALQFNDAYVV